MQCDSNKYMGWPCVSNLGGKACNPQSRTDGPREALIKAGKEYKVKNNGE